MLLNQSQNPSKVYDLSHAQMLGGTALIFLLALGFRLWQFDKIPVPVFDEVYFPKYAAQYLDGNPEWEGHPPLGKYIIALGILMFGRNALGDRIMVAVMGAMIPVLLAGLVYVLTTRRSLAILTGLLISLDGLFLVESRFSLINIFLVAFGLSSQVFFLAALRRSGGMRVLHLVMAGMMLGASASVKWNGLGFLLTLLVVIGWTWAVALLSRQSLVKLGIFANITSLRWWEYLLCLGLMPTLVYVVQWVPHLMMNSGGVPFFWESFIAIQKHIIWWHTSSSVVSVDGKPAHPYCSPWFSWVVMARPISYFFQNQNNIVTNVQALGNPILWWLSSGAIVGMVIWGMRYLNGINAYLLIGYAANLIPWAITKRCTFVYHYMGALCFSVIGLALVIDILGQRWRWLGIALVGGVIVSYFFFLPIWLGLPLSLDGFYQRMWFMPNGINGFNWI